MTVSLSTNTDWPEIFNHSTLCKYSRLDSWSQALSHTGTELDWSNKAQYQHECVQVYSDNFQFEHWRVELHHLSHILLLSKMKCKRYIEQVVAGVYFRKQVQNTEP